VVSQNYWLKVNSEIFPSLFSEFHSIDFALRVELGNRLGWVGFVFVFVSNLNGLRIPQLKPNCLLNGLKNFDLYLLNF